MKTAQEFQQYIDSLQTLVHDNFVEHINTLQTAVQQYYEFLYPDTFWWFFVPLTPTIGFTHCHYLEMNKFWQGVQENKYWIKCNIVTCEIDDLEKTIQPRNITELIHTLHTIAWIKNTYHELHIASVHFSNKEHIIRWWKFYITEKNAWLIYDRKSPVASEFFINWPKHTDILIQHWTNIENLAQDLDAFLLFLNSRNNKALLELIRARELLPHFESWLKKNPTTLYLWDKYEILENRRSNIHFINWILWLHESTWKTWKENIADYQHLLNEYMMQYDNFNQVFFVGNWMSDNDAAFVNYNHDFYKILQWRYGYCCRFFVPYPMWMYDQPISSPDEIIHQLRDYIAANSSHKVLFTLWLHGNQDWSATYVGWSFYKYHFDTLFDLATAHKNLQIIIMSCWSGMKADNLQWNIILSSSKQVSYAAYTKSFVKHLYAKKTIYEAQLLTMLEYHESLLPTSFFDQSWVSREICPLLADPTTYQKRHQ